MERNAAMTTVAQLIQQLTAYPPDAEVVMSKDAEGNGFSPLSAEDGVSAGWYLPESTWAGEFGTPDEDEGETRRGLRRGRIREGRVLVADELNAVRTTRGQSVAEWWERLLWEVCRVDTRAQAVEWWRPTAVCAEPGYTVELEFKRGADIADIAPRVAALTSAARLHGARAAFEIQTGGDRGDYDQEGVAAWRRGDEEKLRRVVATQSRRAVRRR
jgi:hypothetical protein